MTRLPIRIHPEAVAEFVSARDWYEQRDARLALRFTDAVTQALQLASEAPLRFPILREPNAAAAGLRAVRIVRFPYAVLFRVTATGVLVTAIAHYRRQPGYWTKRVQ